MAYVALLNKFRLILENCLRVLPGDDVIIVQDETVDAVFTDLMMYAASSLRANPQAISYVPQRRSIMKEYARFAGAWDLPCGETLPKTVLGALANSDCTVLLGSDLDILFSKDFKNLLKQEKRMIGLPYMTEEETFFRLLPNDLEEVQHLRSTSRRYFELLAGAASARLTSNGGTDITMELGEFKTQCSSGVIEKGGGFVGGLEILPAGQVTRIPNQGSVRGVVVIDRSLAAYQYGPLYESIRLEVENGWVTSITGGAEADRLNRFFDQRGDPNLYNLTELGIGLNSRCKFAGEAGPAEDTHTEGAVSMALGCDIHLGGVIEAQAHMDFTMWSPTLALDGDVVVDQGRLVR